MRLIELKCPNCGAAFQVDADRDFCFCSYCGTKSLIDNGTNRIIHVNTYHIQDDAKIKEAEGRVQIAQVQANVEVQKAVQENKKTAMTLIFTLIIAFMIILMPILVWFVLPMLM